MSLPHWHLERSLSEERGAAASFRYWITSGHLNYDPARVLGMQKLRFVQFCEECVGAWEAYDALAREMSDGLL